MKHQKLFTNSFRPSPAKRFLRYAGAFVFLAFVAHACMAQTGTTARVTGTVTDQSGAVLPGATVIIRDADTNATRSITTAENGDYALTQLTPGKYNLTVDKQGFGSYQQNDIVLVIGQVAEINVQMQVGSQAQKVTVTSSAPVIQTEDSSVGSVIDSQTIVNTPLNGRLGIMGLMALAPGVQGAGAQDQIPVYGVTPSIGTGSRNSYGGVGYTLDGAVNMEVTLERGEGEVPPLDGLAEFKLLTSAAPAEFNQPSQVVVVTKGGTNQVHGMLLEFNRVAATAAKSYFAGALPKPQYIRNEYGGNFSGPIFIPRLYNGKNRSFFFFNYEGFRLIQASNVNSQEPTQAERSGNFAGVGTILDPLTGQPFANNQIPAARINQVDVALQNLLFPLPTAPGTGTNAFELVPYVSTATRVSFRIDHKINDSNQIRGTFLRAFYGPNPSVGASSKFGGMEGIGEHNTNSIVGWTHIFSPTLLTDTTASYLHIPVYRTPQNYNVPFSSIIPGLGTELIEGAPQLTIKNITSVTEAGSKDLIYDVQLSSSVTKVLATHTLKAGFSVLYDNHWNDGAVSPQRGSYTFTGQYSGVGYADFLLGYPSTVSKPTPNNFITRNISAQYGFYVQDDWKATPRLTFNAGLRYDLQWFRPSPYGNASLYVPSLQKVVVFGGGYPPSTSPIQAIPAFLSLPIELAAQAGLPNNVWSYLGQDTNNVGPRLGFAYQLQPNTVVRGAFGIYYNLLPASYFQNYAGNIPFEGSETFSQPAGPPSITMNAPFAATGAFTANPSVNTQHSTVTPYTEAYNLAIEHQFPGAISLRIGYVGQNNRKQNNSSGNGNTAPDINLPSLAPGPVQPRRFVQPWSTISLYDDPIFHSSLNSAQVGVHKQYRSGFMLNAEYQYTRVLGTENFQNPLNVGDSYGNVGGITPHVLVVSYSYLLPFGKGQLLFSDADNLVNKLIGGWQLSGITSFQSGQPFSVTYTSSLQGSVNSSFCAAPYCGRANLVPGVPLYPAKKSLAEWFNPAAFTAPPNYTYGTSGYNMLWGPRYQDWDMSLEKTTVWRERINLQLRMDAFNVFNHPNFAVPNAAISNPANVGAITGVASGAENRTVEFAAKLSF
jgi:Carboxypeptidase regulatory-like domain/TonB dependent receptor